MTYGDLLNFDARGGPPSPNPCVKAWGLGPEGKRCRDCRHLYVNQCSKNYYKCAKRGRMTRGPGTDHRVRWPACGKFEPREEKHGR